MGIAAAVIGAGVIGAGASIAAGSAQAGAIKDSAAQSNATQMAQYNQTRADYAPYRAVGYGALDKLSKLYGVTPIGDSGGVAGNAATSGPTSDWNAYLQTNPDVQQSWQNLSPGDKARFPTPQAYAQYHYSTYGQGEGRTLPTTAPAVPAGPDSTYGGFTTSPGYQFRIDQATKAIQQSAAARGLLKSGATVKAINNQVQGVASDEFNTYANRLAALAGVGQTATGSTAAAGQNAANNVSQGQLAAGQATASAYGNMGSAINGGIQNAASGYLYSKGYGGGGLAGQYGVTMPGPVLSADAGATIAANPGIF